MKLNNKGITLVALVITIIVLLILASVSIAMLNGDNGIMTRAENAKLDYEKAQIEEEIKLALQDLNVDNLEGNIDLNFVLNNFSNYINDGRTLIEFKIKDENTLQGIYQDYNFEIDKNLNVNVINKININNYLKVGTKYTFSYKNQAQEFTTEASGYYEIKLWGAAGGSLPSSRGGNGAYTKGIIYLNKGEIIYLYTGQKGEINQMTQSFNGGGIAATTDNICTAGGGATDVRLVSGNWNNFDSLKSRIMVAAGGAGSERGTTYGDAGGLQSFSSNSASDIATQTSGYKFGIGSNAVFGITASGSGGGYYGGKCGTSYLSSAGGSSFISGYTGCNAISNASTESNIIHTGQPNHYSGKIFTGIEMKTGKDTIPTTDESSTMSGNSSNGYAIIKYMGQ